MRKKKKTQQKAQAIDSVQLIYMGPRLQAFGIGYGNVFHTGVHPRLQQAIDACPSIADLLVPVEQAAVVRRELNFDYAHNMRGTGGKHVTLYREIQKWLNGPNTAAKTQQTPTMELNTNA